MSASHSGHIHTRSIISCPLCKQAKAPDHVLYCIDCCRASAAPLPSDRANKSNCSFPTRWCCTVVVVVVVDSHIQRIVLATEETTVTQEVSHRPIKCQSRLWSQRGTKVNGSHHGDNPLLRPTGIQIATKSYAALQAMAPTDIKTVHQTSLLHIESNLDRLGMLSPTHDQRSQQKTGKITLQPVLINKSKFLKATHFVQK